MNWCLCDVEAIHGSLDGTVNPAMLDYDSNETQEFYPGQSPVMSSETGSSLGAPQWPAVYQKNCQSKRATNSNRRSTIFAGTARASLELCNRSNRIEPSWFTHSTGS